MVTIRDIREGARSLGLSNRPVCIHSSLRSFGWVEGGPGTVIEGLLAEGCTVMAPTFSFGTGAPPPPGRYIAQNAFDYERFRNVPRGEPFDPTGNDLNVEDMGAIPAAMLRMEGRVRGNHPFCSFTAVGPLAHELISGQAAMNVYAPLEVLTRMDGWVVLMGVELDRMTFIHYAEQKSGRNLFIRWAAGANDETIEVEIGGNSHAFPKLEPFLEPVKKETRVGESLWRAFPARESLEILVDTIVEHPEITHCGNPDCARCTAAVNGGPIME